MEWALILPTILASIGAGFSDRETVERLSDEERARLDQLFGSAEDFIGQVRALPDMGGLGGLTFSGAVGGEPTSAVVSKDFNSKGGPSQSLTDLQQSPDEIFNNLFKELKDAIPDTPSVSQGVDIPSLSVEDVLSELSGLGGGFLRRGDLVSRIPRLAGTGPTAESLTPNLPTADFTKTRAELANNIYGAAQQRAQSEGDQSRRALISSGILPDSATFDFETNLAPRQRAETSIASDTAKLDMSIEEAEREFGFKRAEMESQGAQEAARINAQLAAADASNISNAMNVEEQTIGGQFGNIADLFKSATELGLRGAELRLNSNQQDISNDFQAFGANLGITDDQFKQFNTLLAQNSNLSIQSQQLIAEMIKAQIAAELESTGSTVLTSDILNNAIGSGNGMANILGLMEGSQPKKSSGGNIALPGAGGSNGPGFGFQQGCVAGCTPVITRKGAIWLAKVQPGDGVLGADGQFHRVLLTEYGTLKPEDRVHSHRILRTRYGELWLTDNHVVAGKEARLWKPGDVLPFFTRRGKVDAKIVEVDENAAYFPSGDLYLTGGVPYIAGGFVVHSVVRPANEKQKVA